MEAARTEPDTPHDRHFPLFKNNRAPDMELVISTVALSDWISQIRSKASMLSPSLTNHCTSSHSLMPSPVCASLHRLTKRGDAHNEWGPNVIQ